MSGQDSASKECGNSPRELHVFHLGKKTSRRLPWTGRGAYKDEEKLKVYPMSRS